MKYNPHPLRYFEIFERHNTQKSVTGSSHDRRTAGKFCGNATPLIGALH
jgi:hypothetical protein